jgi:hypothetical protein
MRNSSMSASGILAQLSVSTPTIGISNLLSKSERGNAE